ncbi:MAG: hypothetical protein RMJ33_05295 [Saprospiraceae bacterium]|nr:hypothetical protein [Saprospiraceae bacterium]MDW8229236.1 hypothetical protein [Saprospiraceae bacterium]
MQAQELAIGIGIPNILQPGLVKEMIIADLLGHELLYSKRDADACDPDDRNIKYEYLSCYENGAGQMDRMFKEPEEKRKSSLQRILRNQKVFLAIFYKKSPLKIKVIYELEPKVVAAEAERQLDKSRNAISHVAFTEKWASENGKKIFQNDLSN